MRPKEYAPVLSDFLSDSARAAREECKTLAEHTACITLAIVNEIGSASSGSGAELKKIWDLSMYIETSAAQV